MKVLVTGGNGFVGANLINELVTQGHQVHSIDDLSVGLKENEVEGCTYTYMDIRDIGTWSGTGYDLVYHLAAKARIQPSFSIPQEYLSVNFNGTYEIVLYCIQHNIPLIYAGSSSKHSGKFKNPYTFSKDLGEDIILLYQKHYGLKASIARFYNVYGPYQILEGGYSTLIGRWINNIKNNRECTIYGDGEQRRDFTHVQDIVDALIKIYEKQAWGLEFELGRGQNYSVNEIASMFEILPKYEEGKKGEARNTLCTSETAKKVLEWSPKRNIKDYIKNWKEEQDTLYKTNEIV